MIRKSLSVWAVMGCAAAASWASAQGLPGEDEATPARRPGFNSYVVTMPADVDEAEGTAEETSPDATVKVDEEQLSAEMSARRDRIDRTLAWYYERPENTANRSVWGVMHALIAYGVDTQVIAGDRKVNAIGWVCYNGPCKGQRLFKLENGRLTPQQGIGLQGHHGQFLAMLAQSRVKRDFPISVDGKEFTVEDLIEFEKRTCYSKTELTFKLIGLAHYLQPEDTWQNDKGETWNLAKLINEELAQPIVGAACGGTHRLTGYSYAINKRKATGGEYNGEWLRAKLYQESYHDYLFKLKNPDGSFSTQWFAGRGDEGEDKRKLETTGHMTEWMVYSLPKDELDDARVTETVDFLENLMWRNRNQDLAIGPKGHALHALVIYQQRRFGAQPGQWSVRLAKKSEPKK